MNTCWTMMAGAACALALTAGAASATTLEGTYTGHTIFTNAERDFPGVWGVDAFGDNIVGDSFTATLRWNLADGVTTAFGGPEYTNLQTPGTATGTFTINGHTYDVPTAGGFAYMVRSGNFFEIVRTDDPGENSGDFFEVGTTTPIDARLDQPIHLTAADFDPAINTGNVVLALGGGILRGNFAVDSVDITAVPEPAAWALMLAGFGMVGAAARRRRMILQGPAIR